jgi:hypothetical protein
VWYTLITTGTKNRGRPGAGKNLEEGSFFSGLIDEVRIYDVALSAKEIEELVR